MVKILHSPGNHSHHGWNHKNHNQENNIISYEMEDLGIQKIDFDKVQYNPNERLELKHYDSLNEPEIIFDLFSKSFDIQSNKLDIEKVDWANKSIIHSSIQTSNKDNVQFNSNRNITNNNCWDKNHDHEEHQNLSETHHSHNHSHNSNAQSNLNVRAAAIHVLGDIIQSVGVLIAALLIYAFPKFQIIDPIWTSNIEQIKLI